VDRRNEEIGDLMKKIKFVERIGNLWFDFKLDAQKFASLKSQIIDPLEKQNKSKWKKQLIFCWPRPHYDNAHKPNFVL